MKHSNIPPAPKAAGFAGVVNRIPTAPKRNDVNIPLDDEEVVVSDKKDIVDIAIDLIDISPYQPRIIFNESALNELAESIASSVQVAPIIVRPKPDGRFELIAGERRFRASKLLKRLSIEAVIRVISDEDAAVLALIENEAREDLTDYERGKAYKSLIDRQFVLSQSNLAHRIGCSNATITRCLSYFKLPKEVIELLDLNPALLGNKVVADFAKICERGFSEIAIKNIKAIANEGVSQEVALNKTRREIEELSGKISSKSTPKQLTSSGRTVAEFHFDGKRGLVLKCEKGINPELIIERLEKILASDPISFN